MAVNGQKLLPQGNRGGALAVSRPKVSLVNNEPDTMVVIKTRVVEIEKILKGSVALDKKLQDQERKQKEKSLRAEEEKELETKEDKDDKKVKKKKIKIKLGFLDGLIKFVNDVLMGWLLVRMIDWLPQLKKIIPILGGTLDFITSGVLGIVNVLGTFLMWGDKAITGSRGFVKNNFGEEGAKTFDAIVGTIGNLFNTIVILGMTASAFGNEWGGQNDRRGGKPRRKPRSLGDRARRMRRGLQTRAERATRSVRRFGRRIRPTNIKRMVQSKVGRMGKNLTNLKQRGFNALKRFKPSNLKQAGSNLFQRVRGSKFVKGAIQKGKGVLSWADDFAKKQMANVDNIIGGIKSRGANWAQKIGKNIKSMNPMKLGEKVKKLLKGPMDDILKNNKIISQVKNLNVKNAAKSIGGLMNTAKNSGGLKTVMKGLEKAKAAKIGGVDKVIAALMGVLNYAAFGEAPINAILQAIGGLLGYTAGFAIGAPFGGAPGFITGMAGAWVGENAAKLLAKGLAKTGLANTPDPIAKGLGLSPRMLVRDPDGGDKKEESGTKTEIVKPKKIDKIFKSRRSGAEYDLSKSMGGLSREEFDALDTIERKRILQRQSIWQGQNKKEWAANIKRNATSVSENTDAISKSASYEEGGEGGTVVIVENSSGGGEKQQTESESTLVVAGGGDDGSTDALYKGG